MSLKSPGHTLSPPIEAGYTEVHWRSNVAARGLEQLLNIEQWERLTIQGSIVPFSYNVKNGLFH